MSMSGGNKPMTVRHTTYDDDKMCLSYVGAELVTQLDGEAGAISDLPSGTVCTVSVAHLL